MLQLNQGNDDDEISENNFQSYVEKLCYRRDVSRWPRSAWKLHKLPNSECLPASSSMDEKTRVSWGGESVLPAFSVVPQKLTIPQQSSYNNFPPSLRSTEPGGGVQALRSATGRNFRAPQQRDWSERRSAPCGWWLLISPGSEKQWIVCSSVSRLGRAANVYVHDVTGVGFHLEAERLCSSGKHCYGLDPCSTGETDPSLMHQQRWTVGGGWVRLSF